ncbi:MAG: hypothetical protein A2156_14580 [Deltaproteobacteria bacterium RBG_16_48_10]|jgi:hypothetical protein|nr:MAG: hypothetical protein A2156_14580 [Deltaproteobacteria bacterium RBG_16_48_10]
MGKPKEPKPAKLFMSIIASGDDILHQGVQDLRSTFGEIDFMSERLPFGFTDYYAEEMGENLFRRFMTFGRLISIPLLPEIKLTTNRLEEKYSTSKGNRRVNIDPGYVCLEHVILATTKGYTHRPYLRDGIYADLTFIYRNKSFLPLEWTYPDYRQDEVIRLFNQFRKKYVEDLKGGDYCPC